MAYTTIDKPSDYFDTLLYTGDNSNRTFSGLDFQPDLAWIKARNNTTWHLLYDAVRTAGTGKELHSNSTQAEGASNSSLYGYLSAFTSDGFSTVNGSSSSDALNEVNRTYAAWNWKAGDTNTSVSASGSGNNAINACTHRANTTAGFSIIKYTGLNSEISNGQKTKVTHGLGVKPDFLIIKDRDGTSNWIVTRGIDNDTHTVLNATNAQSGSLFTGNQNQSDSTHFVVGNEGAVNANGDEFIAYCFAEKQGYSKFGSYTGNGNADGTFAYTGFKPAWILIKRYSTAGNDWGLFDNKRLGFNVDNEELRPSSNDVEQTDDRLDILSNGFKIRLAGAGFNASGDTFIYMAFAEAPLVNSNGVPANAR